MSDIAQTTFDPLLPSPTNKPSRRPDTIPVPPKRRPHTDDAIYLSYLRTLYVTARRDKQPRIDSWNRNYKIINNRYQSAQFASWAPQPRDSEAYPICSSLVAWLTDQEPDVGFSPAADPNSPYYTQILSVTSDLNNIFETCWMV